MSVVTLADLQGLGACSDARVAFGELFPNGATHRELIMALAEHEHGIEWWEWLAPRVPAFAPAQTAYYEAIAPAEKAYYEAIAPAEKAYDEAIATAQTAYCEAIAPARTAYDEAIAPAQAAYDEAVRAAIRACAELV